MRPPGWPASEAAARATAAGVEADEHGVGRQERVVMATALGSLPGHLHGVDEDQARGQPAPRPVEGGWFGGEAGDVTERGRVQRERRR